MAEFTVNGNGRKGGGKKKEIDSCNSVDFVVSDPSWLARSCHGNRPERREKRRQDTDKKINSNDMHMKMKCIQ